MPIFELLVDRIIISLDVMISFARIALEGVHTGRRRRSWSVVFCEVALVHVHAEQD